MLLRPVALIAFLGSLLVGILSLGGWLTGQLILASYLPGTKAMSPLSAATFCLLPLILLPLVHHPVLARRRVVFALGALVALAAALVAGIDFLPPRDFLQAHLLPRGSQGSLGGPNNGRASPLTAISFLLLGSSALLLALRGRRGESSVLSSAGASLAFLVGLGGLSVIVGYLGENLLLGGAISLPSGLGLLGLGLGLGLLAGPGAWPLRFFVGPSLEARMARAIVPLCGAMAIGEELLLGGVSRLPGLTPVVSVLAFVVFSLLAGGLAFAVLRGLSRDFERLLAERRETEGRLSLSQASEGRLLAELNHRTRNSLQLVLSLADLEELGEPAGAGLKDRVGALALVHDSLARGDDPSALRAASLASSLVAFLGAKGGITYTVESGEFFLLYDLAAPLAILTVEVDGVLRVDLPRGGGAVGLGIAVRPAGGYLLEYRASWPLGEGGKARFGFAAAVARYQLDGELRIDSGEGTTTVSIIMGVCAYGRRV